MSQDSMINWIKVLRESVLPPTPLFLDFLFFFHKRTYYSAGLLKIPRRIIKRIWFYYKIHVVPQSLEKSIVSSKWMVLILATRKEVY